MPPALIAAGLIAAGTVGGALISSGAEGKATEAIVASEERATAEQRRQFDITREDLAPWLTTGKEALGQYAGLLGVGGDGPDTEAMYEGLRKYPGYQFALEEGVGAIEKSSAARGLTQSGQTMKDLTAYGQGLATTNFENYMSRLQGLSGGGQQAGVQIGGFGQNMANQAGLSARRAGEARATGYQNKASVWGGALEGLATIGGEYVGGLPANKPTGSSSGYGYGSDSPLYY